MRQAVATTTANCCTTKIIVINKVLQFKFKMIEMLKLPEQYMSRFTSILYRSIDIIDVYFCTATFYIFIYIHHSPSSQPFIILIGGFVYEGVMASAILLFCRCCLLFCQCCCCCVSFRFSAAVS